MRLLLNNTRHILRPQKRGHVRRLVRIEIYIVPVLPEREPARFAIDAPQNLEKLKAGVTEEIVQLVKEGVSEQELTDARSGILQGSLISRSQDPSLAATLANHLFQGLTMKYVADKETRLQATTLAEVNAAIAKYMNPARLVHVYAGDFAAAVKRAAEAPKPQGAN